MTEAANDLRLLKELAEEIREHGYPGLPGGLRSFLRTKRATFVAQELERLARQLLATEGELASALAQVYHLRTDVELTTDALLVEENRNVASHQDSKHKQESPQPRAGNR